MKEKTNDFSGKFIHSFIHPLIYYSLISFCLARFDLTSIYDLVFGYGVSGDCIRIWIYAFCVRLKNFVFFPFIPFLCANVKINQNKSHEL